MQTFQRHLTTEAFRIAGGIDLTSSVTKAARQHRIPQMFTTKITKSFLDSLYAFLDGLVLLASDETEFKVPMPTTDAATGVNANRTDMVDLADPETRLLLVVSNFGFLKATLIPSMINQLERALSTSVDNDKAVCYHHHPYLRMLHKLI